MLKTYISLLRGINISGHKLIRMDDLKVLCAELGFSNIQTYIQSGNVVFQYEKVELKVLEKAMTEIIRQKYGFDVPVVVKEHEALKQIVASNPFLSDTSKDVSKIYITFLSEPPDQQRYDQMGEGQHFEEDYRLYGDAMYIYCPNGYGNTKLSTNFLESKLKLAATSRNWKTTSQLLKMADALADLEK